MAKLETILFPVELVKTNDILKDIVIGNDQITRSVIIEPKKNQKQLIATVGNQYALTPNSSIFTIIEEILTSKNIKFESNYTNIKNRKFYGDYSLIDYSFTIANNKKDVIHPKFKIGNSYDRTLSSVISFGFYRQICSNGLMGIQYETKKFKHYNNIIEVIKQLPFFIDEYLNNSELLVKEYFEVLTDKVVENFADRVIEVASTTKLFKPQLISNGEPVGYSEGTQYVLSKITSEMDLLDLNKANDWLIYNALNSYIFDDSINKKNNTVREELDKKVFDFILNS